MSRARHLSTMILIGLLASACGHKADQAPEPAAGSQRILVPTPDLSASEPAVMQQLTAARTELDRLIDTDASGPQTAHAYGRMGQLYHAYDLLEAADACYRNARRLAPEDHRWSYLLGLVYERQGRLDDAARLLLATLELAPSDAPTLLHLGQVDLARNELETARAFFDRALAAQPLCHAARFGMAEILRDTGDLEGAAGSFSRILEVQPEAEQVHYPLAQVLMRLGRRDEAQVHLDRVANRAVKVGGRPSCPDELDRELAGLRTGTAAAVRRGLLLGLAGEQEQELDLMREAVAAAPDDPKARQRFGNLLLMRGDYQAAVEELGEAARLDAGNPEIHSSQGVAYIRLGMSEKAEGAFRRALEIRPSSIYYQFQLATTLQQLNRCEEAVAYFSRILDAEPAHRHALLKRAMCLTGLGRMAEAGADMGLLLDVHPPEDLRERLQLASMLLSLGGDERALRHFEIVAASETTPSVRAQAHLLIGQVRLRQGKPAEAERSFQQAVELDPSLLDAPHLQQLAPPPPR